MSTSTVSLREAAERLGVSARTMRRYVLGGQVSASQSVGPHGPEYRVDVDTLAALVAKRGQGSRGQVMPDRQSTVSSTLADRIAQDAAALERAWSRVADLERENAELRGQLAQLMTGTPAPEPSAPAPRLSALTRLRNRWGRTLATRRP